ncbi:MULTISPECIES: glycosyltransferase [unclassified Empedobacter]|uniref:glycosyltransferase n=1 Tax=unclassified Empedobacter TaxID=2643773 RepID=UPI0025B85E72|nr:MULTISPECIES: glycosyltransferase [unclassified Empedobacter]
MKIVHVLNSLTIGGREKVVIELCNELARSESVVIITLSNDNNLQKDILHPNINLIELPFSSNIFGLIKLWIIGFFLLKSKLKSIKPDIIHNHLYYHYFLFLTLVCNVGGFRSKSFRTVHTSGLFYENKGILNKFRLSIEKLASKLNKPYLVSISRSVYDNNVFHFKDYYANNKYIPNGVNFKLFEQELITIQRADFKFSDHDFVGIYVSRLDNGKKHHLVINQIHKMKKEGYDIKMLFVGDGKLRNELQNLVVSKSLQTNIFFIGFTTNVSSYLKIADFSVFPSEFEGFGLSLIEKMYFKLPVIASNIDVFEEVIQDNFNGFLFDLKKEDELKNKIISLMNNKEKFKSIGENAKETAMKFNIKNIASETLEYYRKSLDQCY